MLFSRAGDARAAARGGSIHNRTGIPAGEGFYGLVAVLGISFLLYAFSIPRDFLTDETEYLTEIVSLARGTPEGWDLRSFIYPALIAPFVWLAEALFGSEPGVGILAARLANLAVAGLSVLAAFLAGRAIGGRSCGLVAMIFVQFTWAWVWAAGRVMMDVPAGSLLGLTLIPLLRSRTRPIDTIALVTFGSLAIFIKFQTGPAVLAAGLWHLAAQPDGSSRVRTGILAAGMAALALAVYCLSEYAIHGNPFHSLAAFYRYNIAEKAAFVAFYGPCQSAVANLEFTPLVFSYLLPLLAALGAVIAIIERSRACAIVVVAAVYLASLQMVCHKESRYLLTMMPLVAVLASYGAFRLLRLLVGWRWLGAILGERREAILSIGFALGVLAVIASLLPRKDLPQLFEAREDCRSFVFDTLDELASMTGERPIALVFPCYVPDIYLRAYSIAFEDLGSDPYSHQRTLVNFRKAVGGYGAVVLASGSTREAILTEELADGFALLRRSPLGRYAIYVARPVPGPEFVSEMR